MMLRLGDSIEVLKTLEADSIDACVTDPPAGIEFMGKEWDTFKGDRRQPGEIPLSNSGPHRRMKVRHGTSAGYGNASTREEFTQAIAAVFKQVYRVLKPGGHCLVWALPRTSHWTAWAVEDAGFEIRDKVTHHFGTGFPKSLDVAKAIDKKAGAEREVVGTSASYRPKSHGGRSGLRDRRTSGDVTAPATDDARRWEGWGTALKPATEHWILARKPLCGTVAENVLRYGTGALNVDGCRIATSEKISTHGRRATENGWDPRLSGPQEPKQSEGQKLGRWPANLVLSHSPDCVQAGTREVDCAPGCPVAELDAQSGQSSSPKGQITQGGDHFSIGSGKKTRGTKFQGHGDTGGASRFFYCAKVSQADREQGLDGMRNDHPTVKSTKLMQWLVRLITPPGGTVLDPFMGSGSTGIACREEGFDFVGIEREEHYFEIAQNRIVMSDPLLK